MTRAEAIRDPELTAVSSRLLAQISSVLGDYNQTCRQHRRGGFDVEPELYG